MSQVQVSSESFAAVRRYSEAFCREHGEYPRCFVLTFGCQQNVADSEKLSGMAEQMGYVLTENPEEASLILVNTCAIREHAETKALSIVGQYKHLKAKKPDLMIGVCGCPLVAFCMKQCIQLIQNIQKQGGDVQAVVVIVA